MADKEELAALFLRRSRRDLMERYWPQLRDCVSSLTEEQIWWRPNEASNSIGNLLLHINGQIAQWVVANFTGTEVVRNRSDEFNERGPVPISRLLTRLGSTMESADTVLASLTAEDLAMHYAVFGRNVSGLEAIFHTVAHVALHYGQVAYITKMLGNRDLAFPL